MSLSVIISFKPSSQDMISSGSTGSSGPSGPPPRPSHVATIDTSEKSSIEVTVMSNLPSAGK